MNESEVSRRALSGLRWTATLRVLGQLINWTITLVVVRYIHPAEYGLKSMADVAIGLVMVFSTSGMEASIIQVKELTQDKLARIFGLLLTINAGLFALLLAGAYPLASYYGEPRIVDLLHVMAFGFLLVPFNAIPSALASRNLDYRLLSTVSLSTNVAGALCTLWMALTGHGVWALVAGPLLSTTLNAVILNLRERALLWPQFSLEGIHDMARFGGTVLLSALLWVVFSRADIFIAGRVLSPTEVGLYAVAIHWAALPIDKIMPLLNQVAYPAYARLRDNPEALQRHFQRAMRVTSLVLFPASFGFAAIAHRAIPLILGEQWAPAAALLLVLGLVFPFRGVNMLFAPMNNALGRPQIQLKLNIASTLFMVPGFLVGAHYGVMGLTLAWAVVYPWVLVNNSVASLRLIGLSPLAGLRAISVPLLMAALMFALLQALHLAAVEVVNPAVTLALFIALGAVVYAGGMYLMARERLTEAVALLRR
ncbi:MAG: lipopolysaccharide biosynthesis protein [Gammaproteobacteria bacterium]